MESLQGKVVIVTGGSREIGSAMAEALAARRAPFPTKQSLKPFT